MELVLEIDDEEAVTGAALRGIADDGDMPDEERVHAESAVTEDTAEALAQLVDPFALIGEVPGVELLQASWSGEEIDYDPDSPEWDLDEGESEYEDEDEGPYGDEDGADRVG
ncbi:hypothetical protein ACFXAE_11445 [Streptomyces sp. NPDC059454]|uniref:hypothetical protein n=1 Tax=Streptomyces sp. NPDC059454 TaxID=3346836 RepID=UPI0036A74C99